MITIYVFNGFILDFLVANFLSLKGIDRFRNGYRPLCIYKIIVDCVAVLCLRGRSEGATVHIDGCN